MTLKTLSLIIKISVFVILLIVMLFGSCNVSHAQVNSISFTKIEVEQLAKQNLERKKCLELNDINERYIDSLNFKANLLEEQLKLKDTTIENFKSIVNNYEHIDSLRVIQASNLLENNDDQRKTIKKQNRKLNFWRIFTPVTITIVAIGSLLIN